MGFLVSRKPCCLGLGVDISCFLPLSEKEGTKKRQRVSAIISLE